GFSNATPRAAHAEVADSASGVEFRELDEGRVPRRGRQSSGDDGSRHSSSTSIPVYLFLDFEACALGLYFDKALSFDLAFPAPYPGVLALGSQFVDGGSLVPGPGQAWRLFRVSLGSVSDVLAPPVSLVNIQALTTMSIFARNACCLQLDQTLPPRSRADGADAAVPQAFSNSDAIHLKTFSAGGRGHWLARCPSRPSSGDTFSLQRYGASCLYLALFILFGFVIHNPEHPATVENLALLELVAGHICSIKSASKGGTAGHHHFRFPRGSPDAHNEGWEMSVRNADSTDSNNTNMTSETPSTLGHLS
ncbi:hypothetical protein CTA1_1146, partial [Colletotrichum tanaceti]